MHALGAIFALGLSILLLTSTFMSSAAPSADLQPGLPVRAAFYYPWFPEAWKQQGIEPYTNYHPSLGFYSLSDQTMVRQHIDAMQYGGIQVGIASWWGQGSATDQRLPLLLTAAAPTTFRWSIYYEPESQGDPSLSTLSADLTYLRDHYGSDPSLLRIDGRLVVFVYADASDGCGMVDRWTQANSVNAYLVLKVFAGYRSCARQPDGWHQYAPASAADAQDQFSYAISPGFYKVGENPRLARDLARWKSNIRDMIASGARFQLITTFNEWGEGTAVESAQEWASASGYGAYLDALHNNGQDNPVATPVATPAPTSPATILGGTTLTYIANADTRVEQAHPDINYGGSASLRVINGNTTNIESYLRFTVDNVSGTLQSAKLRVYATSNGTTNGPAVYATSNDWSETKITWNTRLARTSGAADNKGAIGTNSWVEYNVTPIVTGNGTYSFVLGADSTDGVLFASRETSTPPQLVLTLASTSNPTPTSQPSPAPTSNPTPTSQPSLPPTPTSTPPPSAASDPVLLAAGDIASCSSNGDEATAKLLDSLAGTVVTLGDNAYESGTAGEFTNCFHPTWGRSQARIRPAVGNHEYLTAGAAGYFGYFGAAAGDPRKAALAGTLRCWCRSGAQWA